MKGPQTSSLQPEEGGEAGAGVPLSFQAKQLVLIFLFLFSWVQCWVAICLNIKAVATREEGTGFDIKFTAPLLVLLSGVFITNIRGFSSFRKRKQFLEAGLAVVDLDSPYVVGTRWRRILRGETVEEWETLRRRNALWRSLPLACMKVFLVVRVFSEIPGCQLCVLPSAFIEQGAYYRDKFDKPIPKSRVATDFGKNWEELTLVSNGKALDAENAVLIQQVPSQFLLRAQRTADGLWKAWHCSESEWSPEDMDEMAARRDFYWPTINSRAEDSRLPSGQLGSGGMSELNERFAGLLISALSADERLGPKADELLRTSNPLKAFGLRVMRRMVAQETLIRMALDYFRAQRMREFEKMEKRRGSSSNAPRQRRPGFLWALVSTVLLMLNASRPVSEALCKEGHLGVGTSLALTLHGALDVTLLVATLVLASAAGPADKTGNAIHYFGHQTHLFMFRFLETLVPEDLDEKTRFEGRFFQVAGSFLSTHGVEILKEIDREVTPAVAIEPTYLAKIALGILIFMAACSMIAFMFAPRKQQVPLTAMLDVGMTGPFRLLIGVSANDVGKFAIALPIQIILRGLLCISTTALLWYQANPEHIRTWYAMVFNDNVDNCRIQRTYAVLASVHCVSGLVAYYLVCAAATSEHAGSSRLATCFPWQRVCTTLKSPVNHASIGETPQQDLCFEPSWRHSRRKPCMFQSSSRTPCHSGESDCTCMHTSLFRCYFLGVPTSNSEALPGPSGPPGAAERIAFDSRRGHGVQWVPGQWPHGYGAVARQ